MYDFKIAAADPATMYRDLASALDMRAADIEQALAVIPSHLSLYQLSLERIMDIWFTT